MIIAQHLGIDISQKDFKVCLMTLNVEQQLKVKGSRSFKNNKSGFEQLQIWLDKKVNNQQPFRLTMEATGVYYEQLAYFLYGKGYHVSVQLPNKIKAFFAVLNLRSKTDELEAKAIAQIGLLHKFDKWEPLSEQMYSLKKCCRERVMLVEEKTAVCNRLHAESACQRPSSSAIDRFQGRIKLLNKQVKAIEREIEQLVEANQELASRVEAICKLKGLGIITVATVVAETNAFALFRNRRQLTSYSGYDVVQRKSGTSVKGKTKISKKGNSHIRRALHFPALSVIKYNKEFADLYQRVFDRTKIKMKGVVAVQRKLLLLIFTLFNKNQAYDPDFRKRLTHKNSRQDTMPAYTE